MTCTYYMSHESRLQFSLYKRSKTTFEYVEIEQEIGTQIQFPHIIISKGTKVVVAK